jgi:hypothetical protein
MQPARNSWKGDEMTKSQKLKNWLELCKTLGMPFDNGTVIRDIIYKASDSGLASFVAWPRLNGYYVETKDTALCGTGAYYKTLADYRAWERKALKNKCKIIRVGF